MEELWYKRMGFEKNPFSIKPIEFVDKLQGVEKIVNTVLEKVALGKIILVKGEYGMGKTSIIKAVISKFGGDRKVVYYNCNITEDKINIDKLLKGGMGWFGKLFGMKAKNMVLLLDEIQDLSEEDSQDIIDAYNVGYFKSIVLVCTNNVVLNEEILRLVEDNTFILSRLDGSKAIDIVKNRVGEMPMLPEDIIFKIFDKSKNNPRMFLENCEDVCRYAVENSVEVIDEKLVKTVVG